MTKQDELNPLERISALELKVSELESRVSGLHFVMSGWTEKNGQPILNRVVALEKRLDDKPLA